VKEHKKGEKKEDLRKLLKKRGGKQKGE